MSVCYTQSKKRRTQKLGESEGKVRTNCYFTETTLKQFQQICRREGLMQKGKGGVSGKLEEFMKRYNMAHSAGNPQLTIAAYARPETQQPMRVLCLFIDGALSDGQVHCKRAGAWVPGVRCYSCEKNLLRKQK